MKIYQNQYAKLNFFRYLMNRHRKKRAYEK